MAREFAGVDRGQLLLMPPSLVEWLPEDHLVWSVLGAVDQMDLDRFVERVSAGRCGSGSVRSGGDGGVVALRVCARDPVVAGDRAGVLGGRGVQGDHGDACPDHSTIAEFRRRHEVEIGELFDEVLGLCREAGLVSVGVITIDGTKIKANASMDQNRDYRELVTEILREAEETDRREDELYGEARGDELPEQLRTAEGRRQALADAKRRLSGAQSPPGVRSQAGAGEAGDGPGAGGARLVRCCGAGWSDRVVPGRAARAGSPSHPPRRGRPA